MRWRAKVYDMIARRFVAAFFPAAEFDVTTRISTVARKHDFKTEGKVLTSPGWLAVYGKTTVDDTADSKALPALTSEDNAPGEDPFRRAARGSHEATAALHGSDAAFRDGTRRQTGRRRRIGRGDERARPRHAGHARRHHRRPDQQEISRAPAARTGSDHEGGVAPRNFSPPCRPTP